MLAKFLLVAVTLSPFSVFAEDAPDIHFNRTELPLDAAVLAERMEKYADDLREGTEAKIEAKRRDVIAALKKQIESEKAKGNTKGVAAIERQLEVWLSEVKARQKEEARWAAAKARQKGADWKALITDPASMEGWNKFGLPETITCVDGVIRIKSLLPALSFYPVTSQSAVVRGKMKINLDKARLGQQQSGLGFQLGSGPDAGGFTAIFQYPESQCVIHGGSAKSNATVVAVEKIRLPTSDFVEIQVAMLKGHFIVFVEGKKVAEYASDIITNPPTVYLAAINGDAEFKEIELLAPNEAQIRGLLDGQPVR